MEKVKVIKSIPGILNVGDELVSPVEGADFCLEETKVTKKGSSERYVSLDYVTVSENVPQFFEFVTEIEELDFVLDKEECSNCTCKNCPKKNGWKSEEEILDRYDFFKSQFDNTFLGSEASIVYKNLMWFIEWLQGKAELV